MTDIASTRLSTSDPLSICKGFALFPAGTARAGVGLASNKQPLLKVGKTEIATFRFSLDVNIAAFAGICGPAYAAGMTVQGAYDDKVLQLEITDDEFQAGFFAGVNLTISFGATLDLINLKWVSDGWKSRLEKGWVSALNINVDQTVDVIGLIQEFLLGKLSKNDNKAGRISNGISRASDFSPSILGSYAIFGDGLDVLGKGNGQVTVAPQVDLPINVVSLIGKLFPAVGRAIDGLEKAGFYVSFGPQFSIIIPVDIRVTKFLVDDCEFSRTFQWGPIDEDTSGCTVIRSSAALPPANPTRLGVGLQHTAGRRFEYRFGFFFSLNFFKIFNTGASYSFAVPDLLGLRLNFAAIDNTLSAKIGQQTVGFDPLRDQGDADDDIEVVFEPLEAVV